MPGDDPVSWKRADRQNRRLGSPHGVNLILFKGDIHEFSFIIGQEDVPSEQGHMSAVFGKGVKDPVIEESGHKDTPLVSDAGNLLLGIKLDLFRLQVVYGDGLEKTGPGRDIRIEKRLKLSLLKREGPALDAGPGVARDFKTLFLERELLSGAFQRLRIFFKIS